MCICFHQLMLNNVTTCCHPECQEITNELKTNSAASDFAELFAKQHLLKIPQTLKCDVPPEEFVIHGIVENVDVLEVVCARLRKNWSRLTG